MYQEGDKVINSNGVACVIDRIERMKMPHSKIRKNYYVMHDIQKSDNIYYIPQENEENMRLPMTKAEAEGLIDNIPQVDPIDVKFDRFRDEAYRKCMKEATPEVLVAMLKYFVARKKKRQRVGKSLSAIDEKYMRISSRNLFSELSCSMDISVEEAEDLVYGNFS